MAAIRHMTARITNDKKNHNILGNFSIFFFNTSIIQIVTSISANVNIMLFQFGSKNCFVVNRSKGTSEITLNTNKVARYLAPTSFLKPSTSKNAKIGNAILPIMSNMSLTVFNRPSFKFDRSMPYLCDQSALIKCNIF